MSFAKVFSAQTVFLSGKIIMVEVDISNGLHSYTTVGLPDKAVEESRDRISAAIKNSGFESPKSANHKIVVSLAPANIRKEGPMFDVPIALAYLLANKNVHFNPDGKLFLGELSLDGQVQKISGVLPLVLSAKAEGFKEVYVPVANASEASLVEDIAIFAVSTLKELINHLHEEAGGVRLYPQAHRKPEIPCLPKTAIAFEDIYGQETAKRALLISASGGHNIALEGPAGTGKTLLARALQTILPPLTFKQMLDVTAIHSIAGILEDHIVTQAPFRAPHHSASYVALIGGGAHPRPGEVTLAHHGVLFLDEFPEFERRVIETLRQPLEDRYVTISRMRGSGTFPAHCTLVVAMNPCPCGNFRTKEPCTCSAGDIVRYERKLSGPIVDRIDLWVHVPKIDQKKILTETGSGVSSEVLRAHVSMARERQNMRNKRDDSTHTNASLSAREVTAILKKTPEILDLLNKASEKLNLSVRAYHKTVKVARTIADLADREKIHVDDVLEALQYRREV